MAWTNVAKPTRESEITFTGGDPIGLLLALTYSTATIVANDWTEVLKPSSQNWSKITKPSTSNWSNVTKPTT